MGTKTIIALVVLILIIIAAGVYFTITDLIPSYNQNILEQGAVQGISYWNEQVALGIQQGQIPVIINGTTQAIDLQELCYGGRG